MDSMSTVRNNHLSLDSLSKPQCIALGFGIGTSIGLYTYNIYGKTQETPNSKAPSHNQDLRSNYRSKDLALGFALGAIITLAICYKYAMTEDGIKNLTGAFISNQADSALESIKPQYEKIIDFLKDIEQGASDLT